MQSVSDHRFFKPLDGAERHRPARSIEAEQQVLGAMLLHPHLVGMVVQAGGIDLFCDPLHARICEICTELDRSGRLVSPLTVQDRMEGDADLAGLGGGKYLIVMASAGAPVAAVPSYVRILSEARAKRKLSAIFSEAQAAIAQADEDAADVARRVEAGLLELELPGDASRPVSMTAAVKKAMEMANAAYQGEDDGSVKSGIASLDDLVSGFYPGELTLIGGRPSMGKTGMALAIALNAARAGHGVVIASLEMSPEAMTVRAVSEATARAGQGVHYSRIRRGEMSENDFRHVLEVSRDVAKLPITFLPRQFSDIGALFAGAKQAKRAMGDNMRMLIVDYAQLLKSQARTRYEQITEISIALKALAGILNVPVIALSQLSRAVEQRDDKRPVLSDLRESGQLEQDADCIMFCYRDEYYLERERPNDASDLDVYEAWEQAFTASKGKLELIVAKQRQGEIGTVHVRFNPATNLVWEG
jgi:replicative DNA helicase